jgi:hypothetical protein
MIKWMCLNSHVNNIEGLQAVPRHLFLGSKCGDTLVQIKCKTCGMPCKVDDFGDPLAKRV